MIKKIYKAMITTYLAVGILATVYSTAPENPMITDLDGGGYSIFNLTDFITKNPWVDVRFYNQGSLNGTTIAAAITDIGSTQKTLLLAPGSWTISSSLTIPTNINLKFCNGALLNISSGVTVTINGTVEAGLWQVFSGDGTVAGLKKISAVYPEWFGAKSDGTSPTETLNALNKAIKYGPKVVLSPGTYAINGIWDLSYAKYSCFVIEGCGESTVVEMTTDTAQIKHQYLDATGYDGKGIRVLRDFWVEGNGNNTGLYILGTYLRVYNVTFNNHHTAIDSRAGYESVFVGCHIKNNHYGIMLDGSNTMLFEKCYIRGHNDSDGAAVIMKNYCENNVFLGGSIEGNLGTAILFDSTFQGASNRFQNIYFELDGNAASGIYSIKNNSECASFTSWEHCKFSHNVITGQTSGQYLFGKYDTFYKCRFAYYANFKEGTTFMDCSFQDCSINPDFIYSWLGNKVELGGGLGAWCSSGVCMQLPTKGCNLIADPFCVSGVNMTPCGGQVSPTVTLDTSVQWGSGNSTKVSYVANEAYSWGNNAARINSTYMSMDPGKLMVISFMAKAADNITLKYHISGACQIGLGSFNLDSTWKRYLIVAKNWTENVISVAAYLGPEVALASPPDVWLTGFAVYTLDANNPADQKQLQEFMEGKIDY